MSQQSFWFNEKYANYVVSPSLSSLCGLACERAVEAATTQVEASRVHGLPGEGTRHNRGGHGLVEAAKVTTAPDQFGGDVRLGGWPC